MKNVFIREFPAEIPETMFSLVFLTNPKPSQVPLVPVLKDTCRKDILNFSEKCLATHLTFELQTASPTPSAVGH